MNDHRMKMLEDALEMVLANAEANGEPDTEILSDAYLAARTLKDKIENEASAPLAPLKAKIKEEEKRTLPLRKRAKEVVESLCDALDVMYEEYAQAIAEATEEALATNDMEALAVIPDAPPLTEGITFAELKAAVITDRALVPDEYLVVDEKAVLAALKSGADVPGAVLSTRRSWRRVAEEK